MRRHPRIILWLIILLTVLGVLIDLPPVSLPHASFTLPLLNKKITLPAKYTGLSFHFGTGQSQINKDFQFRKGLDLEGGTSVTLRADMSKIPQDKRTDALNGAKLVLERRVNLYGVSEPTIQTVTSNNDYRILVELPDVNVAQAVSLIGQTAQLTFWEAGSSTASAQEQAKFPLGMLQIIGPSAVQTSLSGSDLQSATVSFDQNTGKPTVQLAFTNDGTKKFADITKRNVGRIVAIALDNQVIEAPRVSEPILNGSAVISGGFTTDTAQQLSIALQAGALPVPLTILQQQSIGATLGADALAKSIFAGALGLLIVAIFMIVLYGRLGVLASIALILYTLLILALFKAIPVTLTLAGIAGFILSIGMAVDANILIFERMKEELRSGKNESMAMELGFSRAWTSIRDSNVSTLITSGILYKFGTGIVRGFAFTLAMGVLVSMFSAIVVTRTLIRVFYKH
ncbi:MAG TPA: protein translocase subunit SecD [Patescibacteria group bacterium]|nr:protein translocase subunit SecD [Patescibacteria group bacterium]